MNAMKWMVLLSGGAIALALVASCVGAGSRDRTQPVASESPVMEQPARGDVVACGDAGVTHATLTCGDGGSLTLSPGTVCLPGVAGANFTLHLADCVHGLVHVVLPDGGNGSPFTGHVYSYDGGTRGLILTQTTPPTPGSYRMTFKGQMVMQGSAKKDARCPDCVEELPGGIDVSTSGNAP